MLLTVEPDFCCLPKASDDAHFPCRWWSRDALHVLQQSERRLQRTDERERDEKKKENKGGRESMTRSSKDGSTHRGQRRAWRSIRFAFGAVDRAMAGSFVARSYLSSASLLARTEWLSKKPRQTLLARQNHRTMQGGPEICTVERWPAQQLTLGSEVWRKRRNLSCSGVSGFRVRILGHAKKQTVHTAM